MKKSPTHLPKNLGGKSRFAILETLARSGPSTVMHLSKALGLSYMGIKAQCLAMEKSGYLTSSPQRRERGRPEVLYALAPKVRTVFPDQGTPLALSLLEHAKTLFGPQAATKLLYLHFQGVQNRYLKILEGTPESERLPRVAAQRSSEGHFAHIDEEGSALVEGHNPLGLIFDAYPEASQYETEMMSRLVGQHLTRTVTHGGEIRFEWPSGVRMEPIAEPPPSVAPAVQPPSGFLNLLFDD